MIKRTGPSVEVLQGGSANNDWPSSRCRCPPSFALMKMKTPAHCFSNDHKQHGREGAHSLVVPAAAAIGDFLGAGAARTR